jgi:2'-5' RNA ligase
MDGPGDEVLRLFVALRVGAACRGPLARACARLARDDDALRPVLEDDLHLTLQFLGAVARARVAALSAALAAVASRHAPIDVRYVGLGAFPERGPARVLWVGVSEARVEQLAPLAADVGRALAPLGFPPETRPFRAHVTLARVREGRRVSPSTLAGLAAGAGREFGAERLSDLKLMLSPHGGGRYTYKDLTSHPLGCPVGGNPSSA